MWSRLAVYCRPRIRKTNKRNVHQKKKTEKGKATGDRQACGGEKAAGRRRAKNVTRGKKTYFFFEAFKGSRCRGDVVGKTQGQRQMLIERAGFFSFH